MTENTELFIIGIITSVIMLYAGWKIIVWLIGQLNTRPSASWNDRLRKRGPWDKA